MSTTEKVVWGVVGVAVFAGIGFGVWWAMKRPATPHHRAQSTVSAPQKMPGAASGTKSGSGYVRDIGNAANTVLDTWERARDLLD